MTLNIHNGHVDCDCEDCTAYEAARAEQQRDVETRADAYARQTISPAFAEALLNPPDRPAMIAIPVDDVTYQWGCTTGSDLPITPTSEATARDLAGRYGHGVVRRPVGPWEAAPPAVPVPEPAVAHMTALCDVAGGIPVRLALPLQPDAKEPVLGEQVTLGCSWDGRHQHTYTVVTREQHDALEVPRA